MHKFIVTVNNKMFPRPKTAVSFLEAFAGFIATHPLGAELEPLADFLGARVKVPAEILRLADF